MFCIVEINRRSAEERRLNSVPKIDVHGPFPTKEAAMDYYLGSQHSVLRDKFEAEASPIIVNGNLVAIVEMFHPTQ